MKPIRAVAIDLDGTLLDTATEIAAAVDAMLAQLADESSAARSDSFGARSSQTLADSYPPVALLRVRALPPEAVANMIGKGIANLVSRSLNAATGCEPSAELAAHALKVYQECYLSLLGTMAAPYPGVIAGLNRMREMGLPLACVTNKVSRFTIPLLERTALLERFALVVSGDTYEQRKPHPLPLLNTAAHFSCAPGELLMIGDSVNDVASARAAGCPILCVPYGYNEGEPVDKLDFDDMIGGLNEACDWIEQRSLRNASTHTT